MAGGSAPDRPGIGGEPAPVAAGNHSRLEWPILPAEPDSFEHLTLDLQGTPFQIRVWQALRQVPFGTITSYQALADSLGMPRSARAVGGALGANPLPIIIPCHRVVATNGSLGGYSAGLQYKRLLLSHEQVALGKSPIPLHGPIEDR